MNRLISNLWMMFFLAVGVFTSAENIVPTMLAMAASLLMMAFHLIEDDESK